MYYNSVGLLSSLITDSRVRLSFDGLIKYYPPLTPGSDDKLEPPIEGVSVSSRAEFGCIEHLMSDLSNKAGAKRMVFNANGS